MLLGKNIQYNNKGPLPPARRKNVQNSQQKLKMEKEKSSDTEQMKLNVYFHYWTEQTLTDSIIVQFRFWPNLILNWLKL